MSVQRRKIGDFGEDYTAHYLEGQGYQILARNFHSRFGEIDLIAQRGRIIAFVEVKTRTEGALYAPREAVDYYKQQKCIKTAQYYLLRHPSNLQPRFDVSEVILRAGEEKMPVVATHHYLENAFWEG